MLQALLDAGHKAVGADKAYDTAAFVANSRAAGVMPHVAQNINAHRGSNIDGRTTRHAGHRLSQVIRKRIAAGSKGGTGATKLRAVKRVEWMNVFKRRLTFDPVTAAAGRQDDSARDPPQAASAALQHCENGRQFRPWILAKSILIGVFQQPAKADTTLADLLGNDGSQPDY